MIKWLTLCCFCFGLNALNAQTVIRYNLLGYTPSSIKVLVLGSRQNDFHLQRYVVKNISSGQVLFSVNHPTEKDFGAYGPFAHSYRINLSTIIKPGVYRLVVNDSIESGPITINYDVYKGSADFCLRYMRQQRSGFNPSINDSCHQYDGYTLGGPLPDSTIINVSGGWHDASDYLQYGTTSANATYHLLAAYRDFPAVFADGYQANGISGANTQPDVLDEARWGLEWLVKMHPTKDQLYHQIADDRDHISMRMPGLDNQYGCGFHRPVYAATGLPQGSIKFKNRSTGVANIAGKYSAAFALGSQMMRPADGSFADRLKERAMNAYKLGLSQPGTCQTAPNRAPYFYEEDNWTDDMELAATQLFALTANPDYIQSASRFADMEPTTPWLGADTARHYQWYPFVNLGHYELAKLKARNRSLNIAGNYLKSGIERVWQKAKQNAFYRGVPFIWCSNNLTTSFATQCHWYNNLYPNDSGYRELEQANIDWLLGCNPWGTSMVYGLPANADNPTDPHSAFTHQKNIPIDGGLVDGPVYGSIYGNLIGISLTKPDAYAQWQSKLAVYHDDYGDYSTNEPTMDGTASLVYLLAAKENDALKHMPNGLQKAYGAVVRGDSSAKKIALVFTGHEFADGGVAIQKILKKEKTKAAFFFTGDFVRRYPNVVKQLKADGHYIGPHSDAHMLYAPWGKRDSLYINQAEFNEDLLANYTALAPFGITTKTAPVFLPPYEWYGDTIAAWTNALGLTLINNTPGTLSAADYTTPEMSNYRNSSVIYENILHKARTVPYGLNGYFLLAHVGTDPLRTDKFYLLLPLLIQELKNLGYEFVSVKEMAGLQVVDYLKTK